MDNSTEHQMLGSNDNPDATKVFWTKVGFIVVAFFEALCTGYIPTWSPSCRESPKILGIANSFAGGVFLAIAFVHILPEMASANEERVRANKPDDPDPKIFPLPYLLVFLGYTMILIIG